MSDPTTPVFSPAPGTPTLSSVRDLDQMIYALENGGPLDVALAARFAVGVLDRLQPSMSPAAQQGWQEVRTLLLSVPGVGAVSLDAPDFALFDEFRQQGTSFSRSARLPAAPRPPQLHVLPGGAHV